MSNIKVLEEILEELYQLDGTVQDKYVKCAVQANLIKYKRELELEYQRNALAVIEHKLKKLTDKLT